MNTCLKSGVAAGLFALGATGASAALYDQPLANNAYITMEGLDWAWAFAAGYDQGPAFNFTFDSRYQSQFAWRIRTSQELANAPIGTDFLFAGGNVPFKGADPVSGSSFDLTDANYTGDGACAAAYFSDYSVCNWGNAPGNIAPVPWHGQPGAEDHSEQLMVRGGMPLVPVRAQPCC